MGSGGKRGKGGRGNRGSLGWSRRICKFHPSSDWVDAELTAPEHDKALSSISNTGRNDLSLPVRFDVSLSCTPSLPTDHPLTIPTCRLRIPHLLRSVINQPIARRDWGRSPRSPLLRSRSSNQPLRAPRLGCRRMGLDSSFSYHEP